MTKKTIYYHGTTPECAQSILENGFDLTHADLSIFGSDRDFQNECLYAFNNLNDAIDFICDQGHNEQVVISFTVSDDTEVISDPEYDVNGEVNNAVVLYGDYFETDNEIIIWSQK